MERLKIGNFIINPPDKVGDIEIERLSDDHYDYEYIKFNDLKKFINECERCMNEESKCK